MLESSNIDVSPVEATILITIVLAITVCAIVAYLNRNNDSMIGIASVATIGFMLMLLFATCIKIMGIQIF